MHVPFRKFSAMSRPLAITALGLSILSALAAPTGAQASAFQLKENSAMAMGRAYAGSMTAGGDASVVVNSPASMSDLQGTYFQTDLTAINFKSQFSGSARDAFGRPISGGAGGDAGTTLPVPTFFLVSQINDQWHVGLGFSVPFGFQTNYQNGWVGRYSGLKSRFTSYDATLSASFKVNDQLSLGASFIAQKTSAELTSAINFNTVALGLAGQGVAAGAIPPTFLGQVAALVPPGSDGYARIKGSDWGYGYQLGAEFKLDENDRFAVNYRSKISHSLQGTANFNVPANVQLLLSNPAVAPLLAGGVPFQHASATAPFTTPVVVGASYWHQAQKYGLGVDVAWTKWSVFKNLTVDYGNPAQPQSNEVLNWRNTWYASVGGDYYLNDKVTLRAGVGLDTSPTYVKTRDVRVPDGMRHSASVGIGYKATEALELNASYMHIFVATPHLENSASSTGDVINGSYDDSANLLSLSLRYRF